jgi:hypothetical protein
MEIHVIKGHANCAGSGGSFLKRRAAQLPKLSATEADGLPYRGRNGRAGRFRTKREQNACSLISSLEGSNF